MSDKHLTEEELDKLIDYLEREADNRGYLRGYADGLYKQGQFINLSLFVIAFACIFIITIATIWQTALACGG